jgi:hypothetical protein
MTNADHLLLMFSGTFSWEDVRVPLAGVLTAAGLAQAEAARPSGVARIVEPTRRVVVVFDAERFSDRQMGFSEKVTPTPAQRQLYEEQFQLLDWLFDSPQATVDSNPATAVDRKD